MASVLRLVTEVIGHGSAFAFVVDRPVYLPGLSAVIAAREKAASIRIIELPQRETGSSDKG